MGFDELLGWILHRLTKQLAPLSHCPCSQKSNLHNQFAPFFQLIPVASCPPTALLLSLLWKTQLHLLQPFQYPPTRHQRAVSLPSLKAIAFPDWKSPAPLADPHRCPGSCGLFWWLSTGLTPIYQCFSSTVASKPGAVFQMLSKYEQRDQFLIASQDPDETAGSTGLKAKIQAVS